ncbi:hypothetical protein KAS08_00430 [Candidatus Pacearchaeota archaeon]|nr:hypothetical protein [Candidatus Pacearchaeota archaeon]
MNMLKELNRKIIIATKEVNTHEYYLEEAEKELKVIKIEKLIFLQYRLQELIVNSGKEINRVIVERGFLGQPSELFISITGRLMDTHLELPDKSNVVDLENEIYTDNINLDKAIKEFERLIRHLR